MIAIFNDKAKAQKYADEILIWLKKNRKDYNAERWCDIEAGKSDAGEEYYVKVPPDYEVLNEKISKPVDKLTVSKEAVQTVDKLPVNWRIIDIGKK